MGRAKDSSNDLMAFTRWGRTMSQNTEPVLLCTTNAGGRLSHHLFLPFIASESVYLLSCSDTGEVTAKNLSRASVVPIPHYIQVPFHASGVPALP